MTLVMVAVFFNTWINLWVSETKIPFFIDRLHVVSVHLLKESESRWIWEIFKIFVTIIVHQ